MFSSVSYLSRRPSVLDDFDYLFSNHLDPKNLAPRTAFSVVLKDDSYHVSCDLPGFNKDEVVVSLADDGTLRISAVRDREDDISSDDGKAIIGMRQDKRSYSRSVRLKDADPEAVEGRFEDGQLLLTVARKKPLASEAKRIEIA